jgi:hypothetical protein
MLLQRLPKPQPYSSQQSHLLQPALHPLGQFERYHEQIQPILSQYLQQCFVSLLL